MSLEYHSTIGSQRSRSQRARWASGWGPLLAMVLAACNATWLGPAIGQEARHTRNSGADLDSGFRQPPPEARPWVYWFIMDGNMSREGLTADLEAMHAAGLGGAILMEVDVGIPRGPVRFMSAEWQGLFHHAVHEAERLGLELAINAGPGWTGSGGPWVHPEQSMQHLVASETTVKGPGHWEGVLPKPAPRTPFFGEGTLTPDLRKAWQEYYQDVAVLAFPKPAGDARIPDADEKALYFRAPYSSQPGVKPFLPAPAEYPIPATGECIAANGILDLTSKLNADGKLGWEVPAGEWTILRFGRRTTGQTTRPAPLPGLGFECDKFDSAALDVHYAAFVKTLLEGLGPTSAAGKQPSHRGGWTMLHMDSWEMSSQNWTGGFREEFKKRRGYDLLHYLPAMTGRVVESREVSERFLWDLRQTSQELIIEKHALHLRALGHANGFSLSIEPYDLNPAADLDLGGAADVPMCEFWSRGHGFNSDFSCFEAVSIAHTLGRPVVAAESFTSDDSERWQLYPGALKAQGDWAFASGINKLVFHRYQHQPWLDRWPGMTMGPYGVHWERTQTWWEMAGAYHDYISRCQFLLRRGSPVADICYLAPEGAPQVFRPPKSALQGEPPSRRGYNFDGCSPSALVTHTKVRDGRVVFDGGMSYRVLVLPRFDTMTPRLLHKIGELVEAGATVVGRPPRKSPSLQNYPDCDKAVERLATELWGEHPAISQSELGVGAATSIGRRVGKGRIVWDADPVLSNESGGFPDIYPDYGRVAELLTRSDLAPDFESDSFLRYAHRHDGGADFYFVANPEDRVLNSRATFRVGGREPELWDPVTGEQRGLPKFEGGHDRTTIPLRFEPHQSFFIAFRKPVGSFATAATNFPDLREVELVKGPWEVTFEPNRGAPEKATFDHLLDWTKSADNGVRHFSGIAKYKTRFNWQPLAPPGLESRRVSLDLGEVRVMASVHINGQDVGTVWTAPWRIDATRALKTGMNDLEIRVANLWPNRLIGDVALPVGQRVTWTTWNPFTPDSPLLPSGLLGPVRVFVMDKR